MKLRQLRLPPLLEERFQEGRGSRGSHSITRVGTVERWDKVLQFNAQRLLSTTTSIRSRMGRSSKDADVKVTYTNREGSKFCQKGRGVRHEVQRVSI